MAQATGGVLISVKGFEAFQSGEVDVERKFKQFINKSGFSEHAIDAELQEVDLGLTDFK